MSFVILLILNGPRAGQRLWLKPQQWLNVGRTEHSDVAIPTDAAISGLHFRVSAPRRDLCQIEDLGSTNGTFVNGRRVGYCRLASGDLITAGRTVFEVGLAS